MGHRLYWDKMSPNRTFLIENFFYWDTKQALLGHYFLLLVKNKSLTERGGVSNRKGGNELQAAQSGRGGRYIMKADGDASDKR